MKQLNHRFLLGLIALTLVITMHTCLADNDLCAGILAEEPNEGKIVLTSTNAEEEFIASFTKPVDDADMAGIQLFFGIDNSEDCTGNIEGELHFHEDPMVGDDKCKLNYKYDVPSKKITLEYGSSGQVIFTSNFEAPYQARFEIRKEKDVFTMSSKDINTDGKEVPPNDGAKCFKTDGTNVLFAVKAPKRTSPATCGFQFEMKNDYTRVSAKLKGDDCAAPPSAEPTTTPSEGTQGTLASGQTTAPTGTGTTTKNTGPTVTGGSKPTDPPVSGSTDEPKPTEASGSPPTTEGSKTGMIVGIVVGVIAALIIVAIVVYCLCCRSKSEDEEEDVEGGEKTAEEAKEEDDAAAAADGEGGEAAGGGAEGEEPNAEGTQKESEGTQDDTHKEEDKE